MRASPTKERIFEMKMFVLAIGLMVAAMTQGALAHQSCVTTCIQDSNTCITNCY